MYMYIDIKEDLSYQQSHSNRVLTRNIKRGSMLSGFMSDILNIDACNGDGNAEYADLQRYFMR